MIGNSFSALKGAERGSGICMVKNTDVFKLTHVPAWSVSVIRMCNKSFLCNNNRSYSPQMGKGHCSKCFTCTNLFYPHTHSVI